MCEIETERGVFSPIAARRSSARPWSVTVGCPARVRRISISLQPTPRTPRPSTFETASFAAQRPDRCKMFVRQYICSHSVYTRSRNRRGCFSSTLRIRAVSMMSIPTSELIRRRVAEPRRDEWYGRPAGAASGSSERAAPGRRSTAIPRGAERGRPRRCRRPHPGTGPAVRQKRDSLDGHGLGKIAGLIHIVPTPIRDVIRK